MAGWGHTFPKALSVGFTGQCGVLEREVTLSLVSLPVSGCPVWLGLEGQVVLMGDKEA